MAVSFGGYGGMASNFDVGTGQSDGFMVSGPTPKKKKKKTLVSDYTNKKKRPIKSKPVYADVMTRRKSGGSGRRSLIAI